MHTMTRALLHALLEDADELASFSVPARFARISLADGRIVGWRCLSPDELRDLACELFDAASASDGVVIVQMNSAGVGTVSLELARRDWLRDLLSTRNSKLAA